MIRKLRIKLIIASMVSLFTVLLIVMGTISLLNYRGVIEDADQILGILAENDGSFPDIPGAGERPPENDPRKKERLLSPELPYESRYFSVFLNQSGQPIATNTGKIKAVDTSTAIAYAQSIWESGRTSGFLGNYRYVVYTVQDETHMLFLDCSRNLATLRSFIRTGILASLAGLVSVLLLLLLLSGRIVKPFLRNDERQKQFITDASHELKTPLTIIDADAEILQMDLGENEWLQDIRTQTTRLADLTSALILLARMDEGQPQARMIEFPLSDVAAETADTFQALAKTKEKQLDVSIEPMITMCGDENAIRQLITILLDNAIKYSAPHGQIHLTLTKQRNGIQLGVYNTVEHIARQALEHLFDRFYRADQSRNSETGGHGLGLSIALAIATAHKGKIFASTKDEKSLQITAIFPL